MTKQEFIKSGIGLSGILASGQAPAFVRGLLGTARFVNEEHLPGCTRIRYLESTNASASRINTGIKMTSSMGIEVSFISVRGTNSYWQGCVAGGQAWSQSQCRIVDAWVSVGQCSQVSISYGAGINLTSTGAVVPIGSQIKHHVVVDPTKGIWIDDVLKHDGPFTAVGAGNRYPYICLFAEGKESQSGFSADRLDGTPGRNIRISSFRSFDHGVNILDLISVRFINEQGINEGAMYDRVSGEMFRNSGSGAFILGPDKE